ncbi:MAG: proprotein convertase P-domain-containing protein [Planctomycetota bacterium]
MPQSLEARHLLAGDVCFAHEFVAAPEAESTSAFSTAEFDKSGGSFVDLATLNSPALPSFTAPLTVPEQLGWSAHVDKPIVYQSGDHSIEVAIRPDYIAVDAGDQFPVWDNTGLRREQLYGSSIAVYRIPAEAPVGPSFAPVVSDLIANTSYELLPVFTTAKSEFDAGEGMSVATDEVIVRVGADFEKYSEGASPEDYLDSLDNVDSFRQLPGTNDQFVVTLDNASPIETIQTAADWDDGTLWQWSTPNWFHRIETFYTPNDPLFGNQWGFDNTGQLSSLADHDVNLPEAWDVNQGGSADIIVGVVDDGVSTDHEDITVWVNPGEIAGDGIDNDGNGWIDDVNGWNFVNDNNNSSYTADGDNHGTSVAGIAAGDGDNGIGVAGASYNSPVISARIFDGASVASEANIAAALYYMAGRTADGTGSWNSAHVVNNSWGGGPPSVAIEDSLIYGTTVGGDDGGGIPYFFASGNGGANFISQPAVLAGTIDGVIAVGGTGNLGEVSSFSQGGAELSFVTPTNQNFNAGTVTIETTDLMGTIGYADGNYTGTGATGFGGTSAASPLATGIGALALAELAEQNIDLTPGELRSMMENNTQFIAGLVHDAGGHNIRSGFGMLNAQSLLENIGKAEISVTSATEELVSGAGEVFVGTTDVGTSLTSSVRVRNQGTSDLDLTSITIPAGDFTVTSGGTATTLGVGESVTIEIEFAPSVGGEITDMLTILSTDVDEGTFEIPLRGIGTIVVAEGTVFEDREADGVLGPANDVLPNQVVFLDLNDNGILDQGTTFDTDVAVDIVDNTTVVSPITVSGISAYDRIEVSLDITHTWDSDLTIELVAPDGTAITLADGLGGNGDNYSGTVFDDAAPQAITEGAPPFTGTFRPQEPLANLLGLDANGEWNLRVTDSATGDPGTINFWGILIGQAEPSAVTDATGLYQFRNVANGSYKLAVAPSGGFAPVAPAGSVDIAVDDTGPAVVTDFGVAEINAAYIQTWEDVNGDGVIDNVEGLLLDPVLFIDGNGNGVFDPTQSFLEDTDVNIVDNTTATSTQTVSGYSGTPADIDVIINGTHTFTGDVTFELQGPGGQTATLFQRRGGGGDDFVMMRLDDEATTPISGGAAPFTGSFIPETPLSVFDGIDPNGDWTLSVSDGAGGDTGVLDNWELVLNADAIIPVEADGWAKASLQPGTTDVALADDVAFEFTVPVDGVRTLNAAGDPITGVTYGARRRLPSIGGSVFLDRDGSGDIQEPGENKVPDVVVFLDDNNNGVLDLQTRTTNDTDVAFTNFSPGSSTIDISGASVLAGDLRVELEVDANNVSTLQFTLTAPDGTSITLIDGGDVAGANFTGTVLDDSAATPLSAGVSPYTGTFQPSNPLSTFDGLDPNGTWTLGITDANLFGGTLDSWTIVLGSDETSIVTDALGDYGFFDLPDGVYDVAVAPPAGWSTTATSSYNVDVDSTGADLGLDFGIAQNDHAYIHVFEDTNGDGILDPTESAVANSLMFIDADQDGLFTPPVMDSYFDDTDVDFADLTLVTSTIDVPATDLLVSDVTVQIDATHTWVSDLDIALVAPDGTRVILMEDRGGNGDDLTGLIFNDDAAESIATGAAPFTGSFQPEEPLSNFAGTNPTGTWTLELFDDANGDSGTLLSWGLDLVTQDPTFETGADGWVTMLMATGDTTFGVVPIPGFEFTSPATGLTTLAADGTPHTDVGFGIRPLPMAVIERRAIFHANAPGSQIDDSGNAESAIDTSKVALLPGESSSFANYSNYASGLNGIIVDITDLPATTTAPDLQNLVEFATWDGIDAAGFADAGITPSIELFPGEGANGSTRVKITIGNGDVTNTWLRTTILAGPETALENNDVFYFGNVVGDTGAGNTPTRIRVNAIDTALIRSNQSLAPNSVGVDNPYDINRDGRVNAIDTALVRSNQDFAGSVAPITAPGGTGGRPSTASSDDKGADESGVDEFFSDLGVL